LRPIPGINVHVSLDILLAAGDKSYLSSPSWAAGVEARCSCQCKALACRACYAVCGSVCRRAAGPAPAGMTSSDLEAQPSGGGAGVALILHNDHLMTLACLPCEELAAHQLRLEAAKCASKSQH